MPAEGPEPCWQSAEVHQSISPIIPQTDLQALGRTVPWTPTCDQQEFAKPGEDKFKNSFVFPVLQPLTFNSEDNITIEKWNKAPGTINFKVLDESRHLHTQSNVIGHVDINLADLAGEGTEIFGEKIRKSSHIA